MNITKGFCSQRVGVIAGVALDLRLRLGRHDDGDKVKVALLPARDLVGGDSNLRAQLHALRGCFTSPDIATPTDGVLQQNPNTLHAAVTTVDGVSGHLL